MKYRLWILMAGILLVISVCTVISARNYAKSLPVVLLTSTVPDSIRTEQKVTGNLYYKEIAQVKLPEECRIQEVFAEEGDFVSEGDPILRVKMSDLHITCLKKQLEAERLLYLEETGDTEGELAFWQRQEIEEEISFLEDLIAEGGIVCSSSAGYVIRQDYEVGKVTNQDEQVKLGVAEGGCYLEWKVDANKYREYTTIYAAIQGEKQKLSCEKPVYVNDSYLFTVQFPEMTECIHGQPVELQLLYVSEEYPAVLPKNCIHYEEDGSAYVFLVYQRSRNFGEESYVRKVGVTIEDRDGNNVALKASLSGVVLGSSKGLGDMMAVAVQEYPVKRNHSEHEIDAGVILEKVFLVITEMPKSIRILKE